MKYRSTVLINVFNRDIRGSANTKKEDPKITLQPKVFADFEIDF